MDNVQADMVGLIPTVSKSLTEVKIPSPKDLEKSFEDKIQEVLKLVVAKITSDYKGDPDKPIVVQVYDNELSDTIINKVKARLFESGWAVQVQKDFDRNADKAGYMFCIKPKNNDVEAYYSK